MEEPYQCGEFAWAALLRMVHIASLSSVSKTLVRSMNTEYTSICCSIHFCLTGRTASIMSMVLWPGRQPHWTSGKLFSETLVMSLLRRMRARMCPAVESRDMPLSFPQSDFSPLFLYSVTMVASQKSAGIHSASQMGTSMSRKTLKAVVPAALYSSTGIPPAPRALPLAISFRAVLASSALGGWLRSLRYLLQYFLSTVDNRFGSWLKSSSDPLSDSFYTDDDCAIGGHQQHHILSHWRDWTWREIHSKIQNRTQAWLSGGHLITTPTSWCHCCRFNV